MIAVLPPLLYWVSPPTFRFANERTHEKYPGPATVRAKIFDLVSPLFGPPTPTCFGTNFLLSPSEFVDCFTS